MFDLFLPSGKSSYLRWKSSPQNLEDNSFSRDQKLGLFEFSLKLWIRNPYPSISPRSGLWIDFVMDKESLRMPTASVTSSMYTVYPVNFRTTLDGPTDVLTTIFTIKGLWIDFVMDKKSLRMPTASVTSSMYPVNFRTTSDGPTAVSYTHLTLPTKA